MVQRNNPTLLHYNASAIFCAAKAEEFDRLGYKTLIQRSQWIHR